MKIPSSRTLRDMETAADLRAAGATWETAAEQTGRQPNLLIRWARVYHDQWEQLLREAEERLSRHASNESRSVLRKLLRAKSSRIRLTAADKLTRHWHEEKAKEAPPDPHVDRSAYIAFLEEMNDDQLQVHLAELVRRIHAEGGVAGTVSPQSPA